MMGPLFAQFQEPVSLTHQEGTSVPSDFSIVPDLAETNLCHFGNTPYGMSCLSPLLPNHPSQ
jgi:hypothetical protein